MREVWNLGARALSADDRRRLDALLRDGEGLHAITSIRHPLRDFSHRQLLNEIDRGERLQGGLYGVAQRVVSDARLSVESVRFCASLVDYYTPPRLSKTCLIWRRFSAPLSVN